MWQRQCYNLHNKQKSAFLYNCENNVKHKTTNWGNNGRLGSGSAITCTMVKSKTEWWYDYKNNFLNKQLEVKIVL